MEDLLKTCLYDRHEALKAQMSPFGGFMMPIQYSNILEEHQAVRQKVRTWGKSLSAEQMPKSSSTIFSQTISG